MRRSLQTLPRHVSSPCAFRASTSRQDITPTFRSRPTSIPARYLSSSITFRSKEEGGSKLAKDLNKKGQEEEESKIKKGQLDEAIGNSKELQARTPWHREGSDQAPVKRNRSAGAMTKGEF